MAIRKGKNGPRHECIEDDTEEQDSGDWGGLTDLVLWMIFERLPLTDCISVGRVCQSWSGVVKQGCHREQPRGIPWLVMSNQQANFFRSCYSVLEQKLRNLKLSEAYLNYFWGSFQDWLIAVKPMDCFEIQITLLNPFSGTKLLLPVAMDEFHKLVLSGSPLEQTTIYMLLGNLDNISFSLLIPGSDKWCECQIDPDDWVRVLDAIFYDGYFYLLTEDYKLRVVDASDDSCTPTINIKIYEINTSEIPTDSKFDTYMVESSGNILLVCRLFSYPGDGTNSGFKVYRLDIGQMKWIKMDDLGDQVLFVGRNCCRSFSTKELGVGTENCIYFTNEYNALRPPFLNEWMCIQYSFHGGSESNDWGIFSLNSTANFSYVVNARKWPSIWLTAPLWWYFERD